MKTQQIGELGEKAACRYLKKQGYTILKRNYRKTIGKMIGEIDIIVQKGDTVSFVEVKTRQSEAFGLPCEHVTKSKQQKLIKTAYTYIEEEQLNFNYSFDVVEVLYEGRKIKELRHIPHAFTVSA